MVAGMKVMVVSQIKQKPVCVFSAHTSRIMCSKDMMLRAFCLEKRIHLKPCNFPFMEGQTQKYHTNHKQHGAQTTRDFYNSTHKTEKKTHRTKHILLTIKGYI